MDRKFLGKIKTKHKCCPYNRQVPVDGVCRVPGCRQVGENFQNLNTHLMTMHGMTRAANDALPANCKSPPTKDKEVCHWKSCCQQRSILKKNFARHLRVQHNLTRQQYMLSIEKQKRGNASVKENTKALTKKADIGYIVCLAEPVMIADVGEATRGCVGSLLPRRALDRLLFYKDGKIGKSAEKRPANLIFLFKETPSPAVNLFLVSTFYKAGLFMIEPLPNRKLNLSCYVEGNDFWNNIPVHAFHACFEHDNDSCNVCYYFDLNWEKVIKGDIC